MKKLLIKWIVLRLPLKTNKKQLSQLLSQYKTSQLLKMKLVQMIYPIALNNLLANQIIAMMRLNNQVKEQNFNRQPPKKN